MVSGGAIVIGSDAGIVQGFPKNNKTAPSAGTTGTKPPTAFPGGAGAAASGTAGGSGFGEGKVSVRVGGGLPGAVNPTGAPSTSTNALPLPGGNVVGAGTTTR